MLQSSTYGHAARAAILATCMAATAQGATPGEVDTTFGQNGGQSLRNNSKAIGLRLPDGSLLVASQVTETCDMRTPGAASLRQRRARGSGLWHCRRRAS